MNITSLASSELVLEVCPTCTDTSAQMAAPLADRGINDRLVELRPLVDETRFEFIDVHLTFLNTGVIGTYNFAK